MDKNSYKDLEINLSKKTLNKKINIFLGILICIFIILTILVKTNNIEWFDNFVYNIVINLRNDVFTSILIFITNLGGITSVIVIALITSLALFLFKKKKDSIAVIANLLFSSITYVILKSIIQRPRPLEIDRLVDESGYSFPSGHTTNNFAFYLFAIYLVYKNVHNNKIRNVLIVILSIIPIMIAFSRIYLRVHYPSDVLAGIIIGIICVSIFIKNIYPKINNIK